VNKVLDTLSDDLVSIIVPVYNSEKYIRQCTESLIHQTHRNIEIIFVNDGSTDDSERICKNYAILDNRIKVISQKNSGPAAARNTGVRHATGSFVFFLDADDLIEPKTIEILLVVDAQHSSDLVMSNFGKLVHDNKMVKQPVAFSPDDEPFQGPLKKLSKTDIGLYVRHFLKHPSNHLVSYCWARLYKLSIIKTHGIFANESMRLFEDYVFNLEYLRYAKEVVFVNEPLYIYVMHDSHVSASMAIINSDSLLHDMTIFKDKTIEYFQKVGADAIKSLDIKKEVGHALIHYVIIFLVRSCRQIKKHNRNKIYIEIDKLLSAPLLRDCLQYYIPLKGTSRILPWLMRLRLTYFLMVVCRYKAYKRYGRPKGS